MMGGRMKVRLIAAGLLVLGTSQTSALAETPVQRGSYLVNTIMACGNCHTPRDSQGKLIAEKALSGGLTFTNARVYCDGGQYHAGPGDGHRDVDG